MSNSSQSQVTLKSILGQGGSYLNDNLKDALAALALGLKNRVARGLLVAAPSTASAQLTGNGNTSWRVNVAAGMVVVNGVVKELAAEADRVLHSGSELLDAGQSVVCTIVAKEVDGTVSLVNVKGAAATTDQQVAPDDIAIRLAVGEDTPWVKVAECTINRTADTTVTQTQDNSVAALGDLLTIE